MRFLASILLVIKLLISLSSNKSNTMKKKLNSKLPAFTLTELMVVLVIIGILILIALPIFDNLFGEAYAIEAQNQLKYLQSREQSFFQKNFRYSTDTDELGFTAPKTIDEKGDARYQYQIIQADKGGFRATATAIADFDNDGVFNVWEIDNEGIIRETTKD
jgi:type IV pilus assembly protein PilE